MAEEFRGFGTGIREMLFSIFYIRVSKDICENICDII